MAMEEILVTGVTGVIKNLSSVVAKNIGMAWGVNDDLEKLKTTLEMIAAVTTDAERQQVKDEVVKVWLKSLKDVVYDADDVLDEFAYEAMRCKMGGKKNKVREIASLSILHFKMSKKINNINKKLTEIAKNKVMFQLDRTSECDYETEQENLFTSSYVDESSIVGRDGDKLAIVKMLMTLDTSSSVSLSPLNSREPDNVSVISIVGMGGLGKTTLAQLVYKDDTIIRNFEPRAWVCISDDFDVKIIITKIIESITNRKCDVGSNIDVLVRKMQKELSEKRFLLVLDDLWNDDAFKWDILKGSLSVGAHGSRVLVTTRSVIVASVVRDTIEPYKLEGLSEHECWSIIKNKAFSAGGPLETPKLTSIGKEIAKNCAGLPLAANFLGNLMRIQSKESDWLLIQNNDILRTTDTKAKMLSILKLSYDKLPTPVKQCFSYCSLFPKDSELNRETLIRLWMAEGFLRPSNGKYTKSPEEIGNDYFYLLLVNSFFQNVTNDKLGDIRTCKMHDLVHDLAKSVNGVHDIKIVKASEMESLSKFRRLQIVFDEKPTQIFSKVLHEAKNLRTIISLDNNNLDNAENPLCNTRLRVVCSLFHRYMPDLKIQSGILNFKHLRYLDLSASRFDDVSINHLYNLQTLVLGRCQNVQNILKDIASLKILRHLNLSRSDVQILPDSITELSNLQTLNLHGCSNIKSLPVDIGSLKGLRTLEFHDCGKLDALPSSLGNLTQLRCLDLSGTDIKVLPGPCIYNLLNLEMLHLGYKCALPKEIKNLPKLKAFTHNRYSSNDVMPRGIETLTSLETLRSYRVRYVRSTNYSDSGIEDLAALNSLKVLSIESLWCVRNQIDAEKAKLIDKQHLRELFLGSGARSMVLEGLKPHPSLRKLTIYDFDCVKLPTWIVSSSNCLPNLVELYLEKCKSCKELPAVGMLPCLKVLHIEKMESLKCLGKEFYCQEEGEEGEQERSICSNINIGSSISAQKASKSLFPSLTELKINFLMSLEEWVGHPPSHYSNSSSFPFLENLEITFCPRLRIVPVLSLFPSLKKLKTESFKGDILRSLFNIGRKMSSLTSIEIRNNNGLTNFPLGLLLKSTPHLQSLHIESCNSLQGISDDDLSTNTTDKELKLSISSLNDDSSSLCFLAISHCPQLTSLPDLRLYPSIRELHILRCRKMNASLIPYDLKSLSFIRILKVDFIK